jgi:hypothetical protein
MIDDSLLLSFLKTAKKVLLVEPDYKRKYPPIRVDENI